MFNSNTLRRWMVGIVIMVMGPWMSRATGEDGGAKPAVLRTITHHQITATDKGVAGIAPSLSNNGERIAFAAVVSEGPPHVCIVDFDGGNLRDLDAMNLESLDISGDGGSVVCQDRREIRVAQISGGKRTTFTVNDPVLLCARLTYNGRRVFFEIARDTSRTVGEKTEPLVRGLYRIDFDGKNFKRLAGPEEVAPLRQAKPEEVGVNFRTEALLASIDIPVNGDRVVFATWVKNYMVLFGCDADGGGLHVITTTEPFKGDFSNVITSVAISGDGMLAGYHMKYPDELGIVGFDGSGRKAASKEEPKVNYGFTHMLYLNYDGSRLLRCGRCFNTDGSGSFQLVYSLARDLLGYFKEDPAMDVQGVRFGYQTHRPFSIAQLATAELDTPILRGAPLISELALDPAAIPREKDGPWTPGKVRSRVSLGAGNLPGRVTSTSFLNGFYDEQISQTELLDDGKADGDGRSGDATAGDGIFTSWALKARRDALDAPHSMRVDAQSTDAGNLWHGQVVEIGWYRTVDNPPPAGAEPINVRPPAQPPTVRPGTDGTIADSGSTGTRTGSSGTGPSGMAGSGATGPLDLTGMWRDDNGVIYSIRQIGTKVYWSMDNRPRVLNVFFGEVSGGTLTGEWIDLPGGTLQNTGKLTLKIESADRMVKTGESIAYGASTWTRLTTGFGAPAGPGAAGSTATGAGAAGGPCSDPRTLTIMDEWLARAIPPQQPGESLRYESWGRRIGRSLTANNTVNGAPETTLSRCEFLWQRAGNLGSSNMGTLKEYLESKLKGP